jgi:hypothetical protein
LKIISKRAKDQRKLNSPGVSYKTEVETTVIIVNGGQVVMTPEELKAVEEMFENIRRQLESLNLRSTLYDGGFW